jgi:hypothetical protein
MKNQLNLIGITLIICSPSIAMADGWVSDWLDMVSHSQAEQPHWATPVATVTPRLEQEFRTDYVHQNLPNGTNIDNFGNGKGLEIIPTENTELLLNIPPYIAHSGHSNVSGYGDFSMVGKYRLLSSNEKNGNYILTAFLGLSLPTGESPYGGDAAVITPTIAGGKGFGNFDVQSTLSIGLPLHHEETLGRPIVWNTAFQYHIAHFFWPEVEVNYTHWVDGIHDGKTQVFVTPGVVLGKFEIKDRWGLSIGAGYQIAVTDFKTADNAVIVTARMPF